MDATYYAVPVQIGGRDRSLVCNFRAIEAIRGITGKNPLAGENILLGVTETVLAEIIAILLKRTEPHVSAEMLLDEMEFCRFPEYLEAIAHVLAGPRYQKHEEPTPNPPTADATA